METIQAIEQRISRSERVWTRVWSVALFGFASVALVVLAFWVRGGISALKETYAILKGETLVVDSSMKSFGVVPSGDPVVVSYKLTNRGDRNIRIVGFRAVCRCMVPEDLPFTLRPRESREFPIVIRNPEKEAGNPAQIVNWGMTLFTTNPAQVRIPLTVKGEIRSPSKPSVSGS